MTADPVLAPRQGPCGMPPVVIELVFDVGQYQSAECQLGAHHACPGGVRRGLDRGGIVPLLCCCTAPGCACARAQS